MISQQTQEFCDKGFTVLNRVFDMAFVQRCREMYTRLQEEFDQTFGVRPSAITELVERVPAVVWPAVIHPRLLDFVETLIGPFVQIDSVVLSGSPPINPDRRGGVVCWHRDRFAHFPRDGMYLRPTTIVVLCYLQRMTPEVGPLRVIPGSHRNLVQLLDDAAQTPHPQEQFLHLEAGDVVVLHNSLIHSATENTSADTRCFFGIAYNHSYMRQQDSFHGPNCTTLLQSARQRNDHRLMRLLGHDLKLEERLNTGFLHPDNERWSEWQTEDRSLLVPDQV